MNATSRDIRASTVYEACEGHLRRGVILNRKRSKTEGPYKSKGMAISPDEVVLRMDPVGVKVPMKAREEFPEDFKLPLSELLKCLHYYTSKMVSQRLDRRLVECLMNETALLALGKVVEDIVDEFLGDSVEMFEELELAEDDIDRDLVESVEG